MILKYVNTSIFMLFLTVESLFPRDNFSLSAHGDRIYVLNGFSKEISVYNNNKVVQKTLNLKNISPSGFFDFFVRYDDFLSYLVDSEKGVIYILDENFSLKKQSDIEKSHGIRIYKKVFPTEYNSVLLASYGKDKIYSLKNNSLKEILSFDKGFTDICFSGKKLYVLSGEEISVHTPEGRFEKKMTASAGRSSGIFFSTDSLELDGTVYFFDPDSLKLRSVPK